MHEIAHALHTPETGKQVTEKWCDWTVVERHFLVVLLHFDTIAFFFFHDWPLPALDSTLVVVPGMHPFPFISTHKLHLAS